MQLPIVTTSVLNGSDLSVNLTPACASEDWIAAFCSSMVACPDE